MESMTSYFTEKSDHPAEDGTELRSEIRLFLNDWIPACAGMTEGKPDQNPTKLRNEKNRY